MNGASCVPLLSIAVSRLTVEATAYYYSESAKHEPRNHVQLSQASGATVFAELQLESGDGILAAMGEHLPYCIHCMPCGRGQSYGSINRTCLVTYANSWKRCVLCM